MNMQTLTLSQYLNQAEKNYIKQILVTGANLKDLANHANISYSTLWRKMKKHALSHA